MDKEYILKKWLNNDLSAEEAEAFNNLKDANLYKEIVDEAQRFSGKTHAKVESFDALDKKLIAKNTTSTNWIKIASGFAAIFIVGFIFFTLLNQNSIRLYETDLAKNKLITLPDNSKVNLNELSKLHYNNEDWDNNRTLDLNGEAYFDVEKGKRFDVNTNFGKVSVLGTEFNVLSRDSIFKVSCYEGLVQVSYNDSNVKLPAGTEFVLILGNGLKSNISISEPNWLKNMSVFENASLTNVIKEFEKHYKINVEYLSKSDLKFTGAFEHSHLENALKSITKPLNLAYIIKDKKVIIKDAQKQ